MRPPRLLALLPALLSLACRSSAPGKLDAALRKVQKDPLCTKSVPADWTSTWPVPTGGTGGDEYKVLFYSMDRSAVDASGMPRLRVTAPRGSAVFTADGKVSACSGGAGAARPLAGERYAEAVMQLDEEEFDKATAELLALTQKVSAMHAGKAAVDKAVLSAYWAKFKLMAEPALAGAYYGAQPRFWDWLGRENGETLAPKQ